MSNLYFYILNGVKQNAVSSEELISLAKSGTINRDTLIWRQGYSDWLTLAESEIDTSFLPPPVVKPQPQYQHNYAYGTAEAPKPIDGIKNKFNKYFVENLKKAFDYRGRISRTSFLYFILFNFLICILLSLLMNISVSSFDSLAGMYLAGIYVLVYIVSSISLVVRRLHDVGHSGWWALVPIVSLIFALQPTQLTENQYGEVPEY